MMCSLNFIPPIFVLRTRTPRILLFEVDVETGSILFRLFLKFTTSASPRPPDGITIWGTLPRSLLIESLEITTYPSYLSLVSLFVMLVNKQKVVSYPILSLIVFPLCLSNLFFRMYGVLRLLRLVAISIMSASLTIIVNLCGFFFLSISLMCMMCSLNFNN